MQITLKATFIYHGSYTLNWASQMAHSQRNCCQHRNTGAAGDSGSIPGSGIFPWRGKWQPTPLGNPIDRGAWWTTVHGVTKNWTTEQLGSRAYIELGKNEDLEEVNSICQEQRKFVCNSLENYDARELKL